MLTIIIISNNYEISELESKFIEVSLRWQRPVQVPAMPLLQYKKPVFFL